MDSKSKNSFFPVLYIGTTIEFTWAFENHDLVPPPTNEFEYHRMLNLHVASSLPGGGLQLTKTGGVGATKIVNFWKPTPP